MSKYLKYFKKEFEKYADGPDVHGPVGAPPPRGSKPATPPPPPPKVPGGPAQTGATHGGPPARPSAAPHAPAAPRVDVTPIINMQKAIQNLAKTIAATINYDALIKSMQPQPAAQPGTPGNEEDKSAFQAGYGKDMFSNFMVSNYLNRTDVKGVEYDTDPRRTKMLDKKPSDLKSMYVILESLQRIGRESSERFADGTWGFRTNNALKNVSAIATAVSRLGTELGMESQSFDVAKIAELGALIPENDTDITQAEKIQRAPKVMEILNGVRALFLDFKQQVFMNPTYRNFIEGKAPMMKFGPQKEKGLDVSEQEKPILADLQQNGYKSRYANHPAANMQVALDKRYVPAQYANQKIEPFQINGGDLVSPQTFENWINRSSILMDLKKSNPDSWPNIVKSFLTQVKTQIDQKLGSGAQA